MAKIGDISVNIGIEISEETVHRCRQLLQMYFADHPEKIIAVDRCGTGENAETYVSIYDTDGLEFCPCCGRLMQTHGE